MEHDNLMDSEDKEYRQWLEFSRSHDSKLREYFIKKYTPLVKYVVGKLAVSMHGSVDPDDLAGYGVFGLLDAVDKYDPEKNVKFKTYAVTRIRGAIFDEMRKMDWVPRSVRQKARDVEVAIQFLESTLGRPATDNEISQRLGMTVDEFQRTMQKISSTSILSLNELRYSGDDNDQVAMVDGIEAPECFSPDVVAEREEIRRIIAAAITQLPEKEKKVLVLYYFEDLTLKEIGKVMEVTESRISQLHSKAICRLRARLTNAKTGIR
ncbi:MAG: RNA polymerase sigma factor WhiG [Spirochaetia bacterium]|nr:RNA polymerase sigma factor WhiG [Spirochaetia bacterium]